MTEEVYGVQTPRQSAQGEIKVEKILAKFEEEGKT